MHYTSVLYLLCDYYLIVPKNSKIYQLIYLEKIVPPLLGIKVDLNLTLLYVSIYKVCMASHVH